MIKTLRITGVAVVLLAGVVLASVLVPTSVFHFGARGDKQLSRILNEPNAVDRWKNQHGSEDQSKRDATPPLVKQAEMLAKIINPPVRTPTAGPITPTRTTPSTTTIKPPPGTPKFALVGTAYSPSMPSASFAYIRLADNTTYQWAQLGEQVGHLTIKEIKGDSITCWDGSRNVVLPVEAIPETANMLTGGGTPDTSAGPAVSATPAVPQPVVGKTSNRPVIRPTIPSPQVATNLPGMPGTPAGAAPAPQLTPQEEEVLGSMVDKIRQTEGDPADRDAQIRKIIEEYRSSRITAGETEKLGNLGEELKDRNDAAKEAQRRELLRRLSTPRSTKK
jgi:hypothetical protein